MYHVGVDLYKETSWFYIIDSNGKKVDMKNFDLIAQTSKYADEVITG